MNRGLLVAIVCALGLCSPVAAQAPETLAQDETKSSPATVPGFLTALQPGPYPVPSSSAPSAPAPGGEATGVGDLLVFTLNFHLTNHQDIFLQYCKLYAGNFLTENGRGSPSLLAAQ